MKLTFAAAVVLTSAVLAGGAAAGEATIVPGVGMGKIRIGMTLSQVRRILGSDSVVNARSKVGHTPYLDLGWESSTWGVGFLKQQGTYRVAQVETTLRSERTREGLGVGSSFKEVARAYAQAICGYYYPTMGSTVEKSIYRASRYPAIALVVARYRKQLAFLVKSTSRLDSSAPYVVYKVIVRSSVPAAVDFPSSSYPGGTRCDAGWRERGVPFKPR
jgi:hypothetical protein